MASIAKQFLDEIEAHLTATGLSAAAFGKAAMSDPNFVYQLRNGREVKAKTIDHVRQYMAREAAA